MSEHVEVLRRMRDVEACGGLSDPKEIAALDAAIASLSAPPAEAQPVALDYTPGELDRTAPARIWLQIDTSADNDERGEAWPGAEGVSWLHESVGGLEIQYVRADLAPPPIAPVGVNFEAALKEYVEDYEFHGETADGRDAYYTPTANERSLIEDAIRGFEWPQALTPQPAAVTAALNAQQGGKKHDGPCWRNSHADCGC